MTLAVLAEGLAKSDPDRYAMAMLAPPDVRARLITLYVLSGEFARAPLAATEGLVAEMRVQWWIDQLDGLALAPPPPHELLTPLYQAWGADGAQLSRLARPRRHDAWRVPFETVQDVGDYISDTGGVLMALAARACGFDSAVAADQGFGAGMAAWLAARPALDVLNLGLKGATPAMLAELAKQGLAAFARAHDARRQVPRKARAVLFAGAGAEQVLRNVAAGHPPAPISEFARRAALAKLAVLGRWSVAG